MQVSYSYPCCKYLMVMVLFQSLLGFGKTAKAWNVEDNLWGGGSINNTNNCRENGKSRVQRVILI